MSVHMNGKRRLRVVDDFHERQGFKTTIYDADTGEEIINITKIVLLASLEGEQTVEATYNVMHLDHTLLINYKTKKPVERTVVVPVVHFDIHTVIDSTAIVIDDETKLLPAASEAKQ